MSGEDRRRLPHESRTPLSGIYAALCALEEDAQAGAPCDSRLVEIGVRNCLQLIESIK